MGRVFSSKTTKWFRFKCWLMDTFIQILTLPSYIWPKPLQSTPLSKEEEEMLKEMGLD